MSWLKLLNRPKMTTAQILSQPTGEAWKQLAKLGYAMQGVKRPTDPAGKTSYRMLDNGIPVTEFEGALTWDEAVGRREQYAQMELKRLAELEQEAGK